MDGESLDVGPLPTFEMTSHVTVDAVDGDGNADVTIDVDDVTTDSDQGDPQSIIEDLDSLHVQARISPRGETLSTDSNIADIGDPTVEEQLGALIGVAAGSLFPEEEVGVGASWSITNTLALMGLSLTNTTVFTLTELSDDAYTLTVRTTQSGTPGPLFDFPGVDPSEEVMLESSEFVSWTEVNGRFAEPVAESRSTSASIFVLSGTDDTGDHLILERIGLDATAATVDVG
jgi:hypothetical protein